MISYLVYFVVFLILCFVLYLAAKAIQRGLDAKNANKNLHSGLKKNKEKFFFNKSNELKKKKKY